MGKYVNIYWGRFLFGLLLIPAAIGAGYGILLHIKQLWTSSFFFLIGFFCYTLLYPVIKKPFRSYVLGHELAHVVGIWLFRGKVHDLKVSRKGGMVHSDKNNLWISLMPYFLPIYTIFIIGIYAILSILWDLSNYNNLLAFIIGFTWSFHIWMTIHVLLKKQPDVRHSGVLFSLVIIFLINVVMLGLLLAFICPELSLYGYISDLFYNIKVSYLWLLHKVI